MYALIFFGFSCFLAVILVRLWCRPYPRGARSLNVWFGPLPRHGENQIRYNLRDALYALAWSVGLFLPVLLLAKLGMQIGFGSESPVILQVIFIILALLAYLMAFNLAACLLKAFFLWLFMPRRVFNETLGKFVTERSYR